MLEYVKAWYRRYFTDPEAALLSVLLLLGFFTIYFLGAMLAPLLTAVVLAYLLEGSVTAMERRNFPRLLAVNLVFLVFITFLVFLIVVLMPIVTRQTGQFLQEVPNMINNGQAHLLRLSQKYHQVIPEGSIRQLLGGISGDITKIGQGILSFSFASIPLIVIYLVLVPLMIFFFLKDKRVIMGWLSRFLPEDRRLINHLWNEMDAQIGNYVRGKVYEIIIVGAAAYVVFKFWDLHYASLLALSVGLSVLIPYIGAFTITIPVALVAYFQWGLGSEFYKVLVSYIVLQFLDGNVLVPILFGDVVKLHPIAIIAAILIFGGLWGFWGVFFAIPLATLVKALINVWPTRADQTAALEAADDMAEDTMP